MGSLSFDDLRMFFSLLFSTKVELSTWYASLVPDFLFTNSVYSIVALFVPLLDNLIGINLDFDFLYTSSQNYSYYDTSSDSLIDWCCTQEIYSSQFSKMNLDPVISTFSIFNSFVDSSTFHLMEGQLNVYDRAFLLAQYDFFSSYVTRSFLSYNVWIDLLNANKLDLNENLSILKQILVYYNSSESIGTMQSPTSLNLELVSIGFILICISLLIKLAVAPFHFWSLDVYEGSPNTTTFFFAVVPKIGLFVLLMRLCYVSFYQIFESYQTFFFFLLHL